MSQEVEVEVEVEADVDVIEKTRRILGGLKLETTSLITLLQHVQDHFGYLPGEAMLEVAGAKGVPPVRVFGVASFYNQFRFIPPGKYPIKMCMGTACHIRGGRAIMKVWETKLGIGDGEVTADLLFSLDRVACVGCCAMAPVALVGEKVHGNMMATSVDGILLAARLAEEKEAEQAQSEQDPGHE